MDRELAQAVLSRWNEGLPVFEGTLYKAAAYLGIDPEIALLEARYYTVLDQALIEKQAGYAFAPWERALLSLAAGHDPDSMEKTAGAYGLDQDELIIRTLLERNWAPDLMKLALALPPPQPGADPSQNPMMAPPQPEAQVQQQPEARDALAGGPTAPNQVPPSPEGNLDQILQMAGQAQSADQGGGLPPAGGEMAPPPPPPPSPEEKIQQAQPDLPPENVARYAQSLAEIEQQTGIAVTDPKQIQKIVAEGQKQDAKIIDQAIKDRAQQATVKSTTSLAGPKPPAPPAPGGQAPPAAAGEQPGGASPEGIAKAAAAGQLLAHFFG